MLGETPQKFRAIKGHHFSPVVAVISPAKHTPVSFHIQQAVIRRWQHFMGVPSQVFNYLPRAGKRLFGINYPIIGLQPTDELIILRQLVLQPGNEFGPEHHGKDFQPLNRNTLPVG